MLVAQFSLHRREFMGVSLGTLGLSLPEYFSLRSMGAGNSQGFGKARSVIVLYCWGGMSHLETWDLKPLAPSEYRGEFRPISTSTPGIRVGEHMPLLARQTHRLAIIRSMHHRSSAHGKGMYWNFTGHPPTQAEVAVNQPPSRRDWPSLGAMIASFRKAPGPLPSCVQIPYPMVDNNTLQAGENAGWLGQGNDPVIIRPDRGRPWGGVSRDLGSLVLQRADGVDQVRLQIRESLVQQMGRGFPSSLSQHSFEHFRHMASDMILSPRVQAAFNLDREPLAIRQSYGDHLCGQSLLLARRLNEAGVPAITVICAAGDLNGAAGDHWDTHGNNFNRLKNDLLPPLDRAGSALLNDLADRGRLEETLVVFLTEFGRTPLINGGAGRDHYPSCYSVALAGGGIRGGRVYGSSDRLGAFPLDQPCGPNDVHATIFHALGIPSDAHLRDNLGRTFPLTDGRVVPLF
jgi:hypothetical protein